MREQTIPAAKQPFRRFPYSCGICNKPVDLKQDRYTDEDGKVVHETCYTRHLMSKRLMSGQNDPPDHHHTE